MNVLLIDDHESFLDGMVAFLSHAMPTWVIQRATSISEALRRPPDSIDAVFQDLSMPDANGMDGVHRIRNHFEAAVLIIISGEPGVDVVERAIAAGASGFLPKSMPASESIAAYRAINEGGRYLPDYALSGKIKRSKMPEIELTGRPLECVMEAAKGFQNKVIARRLGIAPETVKSHLQAAYRVLEVSSREEAAQKVYALGLRAPRSVAC